MLLQDKPGKPINGDRWRDRVKDAITAAGVQRSPTAKPLHALRHTFGTYAAMCGESMLDICHWMCHCSITVTESFYVHYQPQPGVAVTGLMNGGFEACVARELGEPHHAGTTGDANRRPERPIWPGVSSDVQPTREIMSPLL